MDVGLFLVMCLGLCLTDVMFGSGFINFVVLFPALLFCAICLVHVLLLFTSQVVYLCYFVLCRCLVLLFVILFVVGFVVCGLYFL